MRSCGRCNPPPRGTGRTLLRLLRRSRASQWADGCLLVIRLRRPDVTIPTVQVAPPGYSLGGSTNRGSAAALNSTFGSTGAPQHGTPALYDDTMSDGGATERALAAMDTATGVYQDDGGDDMDSGVFSDGSVSQGQGATPRSFHSQRSASARHHHRGRHSASPLMANRGASPSPPPRDMADGYRLTSDETGMGVPGLVAGGGGARGGGNTDAGAGDRDELSSPTFQVCASACGHRVLVRWHSLTFRRRCFCMGVHDLRTHRYKDTLCRLVRVVVRPVEMQENHALRRPAMPA